MRSQSGRIGFSLVVLFGAAGAVFGACTASTTDQSLVTTGSGNTAGTMITQPGSDAGISQPFPNGGADQRGTGIGGAAGATCTAGGGVGGALPTGTGGGVGTAGPQPTIPTTITTATTPVPPLSGGTLLALSDGTTIAASDPERDQVYLVDTSTAVVRGRVALQAGDEPGRLVQDAAGLLHVVLRRGGGIATIDPAVDAGTVTARQSVCTAPRGIAYQKDSDQIHVACAGGELVSLPAAGGAATRTLTLDRDLRDVVVGASGTLLVSTFRKAQVLVVDRSGTVGLRMLPGSGMVPSVMGTPQMRTPSVAWRMVALDQSASSVVMLHQTGITDEINPVAGGYTSVRGCGGIVQPGVSVMDPTNPNPGVVGNLGNLSLAVDVAVSPDRQKVAIAVAGNSNSAQGPSIVEQPISSVTTSPPVPCSMIGTTISTTPPPGQVVAVAYLPSGVLFAQTREPAALWRGDTGGTIALASDSRTDTGQYIFHVNAGGGLACASCHPEGGEDGRVWNFLCTGARRTQSIRGGISQTAPFHWDGSEHDFSGLMDDVFSGRMSGPRLNPDQKAALQGWIDTIPAMPTTAGLDAAAVERGKAIFTDATVGCAACHAGALLTNNLTIDVGTGQAFQIPSLRGVSWRAPFMHNGCAATLTDRLTSAACGGGDKHGFTSNLTSAQIGDLTTYLQSL
jgi:mono/diheme cytochrome c family protein